MDVEIIRQYVKSWRRFLENNHIVLKNNQCRMILQGAVGLFVSNKDYANADEQTLWNDSHMTFDHDANNLNPLFIKNGSVQKTSNKEFIYDFF